MATVPTASTPPTASAGPDTTDQPLISVDVVSLHLDRREIPTGVLSVIVGNRIFEPHLGAPALPGVLLGHERVEEAMLRALASKIGAPAPAFSCDAGVFDNPDRDPRGPTLSIAKIATLPVVPDRDGVTAIPLVSFACDEPAGTGSPGERLLPFDHDHIVRSAAGVMLARFWAGPEAARSLLGDSFTIKSLAAVLGALGSAAGNQTPVDVANLQRTLRRTGWAQPVEATITGRGRPPLVWRWA